MTDGLVAVITAAVSIVGAVVSVWYGVRSSRIERLATAEQLATMFREPLLQAVFNLETRIYNIVMLSFFERFLGPDSQADEREYAVLNTMYVFAQYFCWIEIIRRESQFLDARSVKRNRDVAHAMEAVRDAFADSITTDEETFRLFRGEQRALGEVMLVAAREAQHQRVPRWECLGYAPFVKALDDPDVSRWFTGLRRSIAVAATDGPRTHERLRTVQRGLVDIADVLDPRGERIPPALRLRLDPPARER